MSKRAFTLVELLVVIAIMALLREMLLPTLHRVRRQGKAVACQSNLHQLGLAFSACAAECDGRWPEYVDSTGQPVGPVDMPAWWPQAMFLDVQGNNDVLFCPMASKHVDRRDEWAPGHPCSPDWGAKFSAWKGLSPDGSPFRFGSYGMNGWLGSYPLCFS